ncbi:MAG: ABC transporter substrate-binding protein [Firmicutes bacterium]|nr:ABC transporter substrate-binding protein [Bacillota bacterium]
MKKLKRLAALLLCACMCLTLSGCRTWDNFYNTFFAKETDEPVVYIGIFEPLTGADASAAADEVAGIELAHEIYGYVMGTKVELLYGDNQSDTAMAASAAQGLIDKGASVVLGSYRSVLSLAASDVFSESKTPAICITAKNPLITQTNPYYFRVCYIDAFEGRSAARYVLDCLGETEAVVIMAEGDDYSQALAEQFVSTMEKANGREGSIRVLTYSPELEDLTPVLRRLEMSGCSTVFFPGSAVQGDAMIRAAKNGGFDFKWIGDSRWEDIEDADPQYRTLEEDYLVGVSYIEDYDISAYSSDTTQIMLNEYAKRNGQGAVPSEEFAFGFDAYLLALAGMEEASSTDDGELIASKLTNVYELEGATGSISMGAQGDPLRDVIIEQITSEGTQAVFTVAPRWGE